jgi:hypothetical protein
MTPQIQSLGDMAGKGVGPDDGGIGMPFRDKAGGGGGGGGGAQEGLGQIYSGAGTVGNAINTAAQALGGGGGDVAQTYAFKKGGYVGKGGKLNLGSGRVSTTSKNKSNSNW